MNTRRKIIGEIEQLAVDAIVHQPDERKTAERHFSDVAKKIVEKAMQVVDIMEIGPVCRRAVTGAALQDYDLLAKLLTDKDFDRARLDRAVKALASERSIDYPPTVGCPTLVPGHIPSGADGTEAATRNFPDRRTVKNGIGYADGYVYSVKRQGRKLVGVVDYVDVEWRGYVYEGEKIILEVSSDGKGKSFVTGAMRAAMHESIMKLTHARRYRQNRKAKRAAAALTPSAELAATVARQQGDDDLAERLENA